MGSISIWHWVISIGLIWLNVLFWISIVRILKRTGHNAWWSLVALVPIINVIAMWRFSKSKWPALS